MWNNFIRNNGKQVYLVPLFKFKKDTKYYFMLKLIRVIIRSSRPEVSLETSQNSQENKCSSDNRYQKSITCKIFKSFANNHSLPDIQEKQMRLSINGPT